MAMKSIKFSRSPLLSERLPLWRQRLVLAVDAANEPALRTYAAAGFQAWDRRSVFIRVMA